MTEQQLAAMEQALEALYPISHNSTDDYRGQADKAITALRTAIEQAKKQPCNPAEDGVCEALECCKKSPAAQRQWVGLTDEELRELEKHFEAERVRTSDEEYLVIYPAAYWQWQRAIEAKLRAVNGFSCEATEKNGG